MTKDDIKFLVLTALGYVERPDFVQTDDNAVRIVNNQYDHYLSLCISKGKWNFFTAQTELEQQEDEGKYLYKYEIPEDFEVLKHAYTDAKQLRPIQSYEVYGGYLHTNEKTCFIDYQKKVCEDSLAPYFVEYFRLYMASNLCQLITGDVNLEKSLTERAAMAYQDALAIDNMQKPTRHLNIGTFTDIRNW